MSEISDLLERFRRGPELVATVMTGAAGPELDFTPGPEKWSIRQIVAHLADGEIVGAARFRSVIAEDNPRVEAYDQDAWAKRLNYARRKTSESLETFRRIRAENYDLLRELPEAAYERKGTHSKRGLLTLRDLLKIYAEHAEGHAQQLRALRDLYKAHRAAAKG